MQTWKYFINWSLASYTGHSLTGLVTRLYWKLNIGALDSLYYRMTNEPIEHERDRRQSTSYSTEEILAQALCQGSTTKQGRVYAVGRNCTRSAGNCQHICSSPQLLNQDTQLANSHLSCIGAFHVYLGRPTTVRKGMANTARLGLKTLRYSSDSSCLISGCGPNFCCCIQT